ncbi:MAG: SRPBCC family protein [Planctomycetota bacterium]|jgi:hypothetical protein
MADKKKKKGGGGSGVKLFLLLILVVGGGGLGYVAMQEDTFKVERSTTIDADVDDTWEWIGNYKQWPEWEPWSASDDTMTWSQQDEEPEVGSKMKWKGKDGEGTMTWTNIKEDGDTITADYDLEFENMPKATGKFVLAEKDGKTTVTWSMGGNKGGMMGKAMFAGLGVTDEIGSQFEKGLATLKGKVEGS